MRHGGGAGSRGRGGTWLDATEALAAFKNESEFKSACVITVDTNSATVALSVQGERHFNLEQGKKLTGSGGTCFPDPRKTTVILYNGSNSYCGVVGRGRRRPSAHAHRDEQALARVA